MKKDIKRKLIVAGMAALVSLGALGNTAAMAGSGAGGKCIYSDLFCG